MKKFKIGDKFMIDPKAKHLTDNQKSNIGKELRVVDIVTVAIKSDETPKLVYRAAGTHDNHNIIVVASYGNEMIPCDEKAVKVYDNILGYKVVVIPHLKQVRLLQRNKEVVKVELSDDETIPFDPVYGFLMAYAKDNTKSNTLLQEGLEKLRHDPVPEPKVKKVDDPIVWISNSDKRIRLSDLKSLETQYIVNIVKLILRQGLSQQTDFNISNTYYIFKEAQRRGELRNISDTQFIANLEGLDDVTRGR